MSDLLRLGFLLLLPIATALVIGAFAARGRKAADVVPGQQQSHPGAAQDPVVAAAQGRAR